MSSTFGVIQKVPEKLRTLSKYKVEDSTKSISKNERSTKVVLRVSRPEEIRVIVQSPSTPRNLDDNVLYLVVEHYLSSITYTFRFYLQIIETVK